MTHTFARTLRHDPYSTLVVPGFGTVPYAVKSRTVKNAREACKMQEKKQMEEYVKQNFANVHPCEKSEADACAAMAQECRAVALNDGHYSPACGARPVSLLSFGFVFIEMTKAAPREAGADSAIDLAGTPLVDKNDPNFETFALGQVGYHTTAQQLFDLLTEVMRSLPGESRPVVCVSEGDRKSRRTGVWFITVPRHRSADLLSLHHRLIFGADGAYVSPSADHAAQQWFNVLEFVALRNCYAQLVKSRVPAVHEKFKTGSFLMTVEYPMKGTR